MPKTIQHFDVADQIFSIVEIRERFDTGSSDQSFVVYQGDQPFQQDNKEFKVRIQGNCIDDDLRKSCFPDPVMEIAEILKCNVINYLQNRPH